MTTFYFLRHGETVWNKEGKLQGWLDSPLTTTGCAQVQATVQDVTQPLAAVYASTSGRAIQTAHYFQQPVHLDERLREIYLGKWQGQSIAALQQNDEYLTYCHDPTRYIAQHTESFHELTTRVYEACTAIAARHPHAYVAVVTHGVALRCLLARITQQPLLTWWHNEIQGGQGYTVEWQQQRIREGIQ
ncbi:phosphoglycerate mutase [Lysinibacillus alkalisoli]|uniref:Phosphoglycerate mutase n=1 Tax=Lysinibacillus alkalisoli TaxID=1911548 RepID=A0A917G9Y9_9BACI|nr:histidine phosphatase family protein [Lysinibacillus alkalisoli]GGG31555.1 phosphoglycerate mutase [Lysinibacillus alkalisoli]